MGKVTAMKKPTSTALARRGPTAPPSSEALIVQYARDPKISVEKLERLMAMQERMLAHQAKAAFDAAFVQMQDELPVIDRKGKITDKHGALRSRFSKLEDIQKATKPILKKFGFSMRHRTEWPADKPGIIRVIGILTHQQGHREESAFEAKEDVNEYRTQIQSQGSTVSYGRRYTMLDLLNIEQRGVDNDGQGDRSRQRDASGSGPSPEGQKQAVPPAANHANANEPITDKQRQRLFVIARKAGRSKEELRDWLHRAHALASTKDIRRKDYDVICRAVEAPGPLGQQDREPGGDDE